MKLKNKAMKAALLCTALVAAPFAQAADAPPSHEAFPEVYKLIQDNEHFRVVEATWKPGQKDAVHSHFPAVIYWITDCELSAEIPGGKPIAGKQKAGTTKVNPAVQGHIATNNGKDTCKALLVERK